MKTDDVDREARRVNRWIAFGLAAFFLLGVGAIVIGVADRRRIGDVKRWRSGEATVVHSEVVEVDNPYYATYRDSDGRTREVAGEPRRVYVLSLDYELVVGGKSFRGFGTWGPSAAQRLELDAAGAPQQITVYYPPEDPGSSWMTPPSEQASSTWLPMVLGTVFCSLSTAVAALWVWIERQGERSQGGSRELIDAPADIEVQDVEL